MPAQHRCRNQLGRSGSLVTAALKLVQRGITQLLALGILRFASLLVPLRCARVEVPAVEVNALALLFQLFEQRTHVCQSVAFKMQNPTTTSATCTPVLSM